MLAMFPLLRQTGYTVTYLPNASSITFRSVPLIISADPQLNVREQTQSSRLRGRHYIVWSPPGIISTELLGVYYGKACDGDAFLAQNRLRGRSRTPVAVRLGGS